MSGGVAVAQASLAGPARLAVQRHECARSTSTMGRASPVSYPIVNPCKRARRGYGNAGCVGVGESEGVNVGAPGA